MSTIESHLAYFVSKGKLDILKVMDQERYNIIAGEINSMSDAGNPEALKNKLGPNFSYGEIKLVMADLGLT